MRSTRRGFFGAAIATVVCAATPRPMTIVRPSTDFDLTATTLLEAMGRVGEGPYTLRVPPEGVGWAREALCRAFGPNDARYDDITIKVERLDEYIDSWALDNGRTQFYTIGA